VPPVVQREIGAATGPASRAAGNPNATAPAFTYDFTLDSSGSFWYHRSVQGDGRGGGPAHPGPKRPAILTTPPKNPMLTHTSTPHSHSSVQYMDGLRGALIVDDPYALDPYSENHIVSSPVVFATDWNWNTTAVLLPYAQQGGNNNTLVSTSTLVNGWGQTRVCRAAGTCRVPVLRGTPSTCGSPKTRMRLISGAGSVRLSFFWC
jgi:FtsP/CotA-like multicopper oxidase with cupredoxin domain